MVDSKRKAYTLIEDWCEKNPGISGATLGLMRLVLSLYNAKAFSFSLALCVQALDEERLEWAKSLIADFFDRGENPDLLRLARKFAPLITPFEFDELPKKNHKKR